MPRPLVCIVLLNWNRLVEISECLDSVDALEYKNFRTIIVDNGSSDGSVEVLRARYPQAAVIENKRNLGYAGETTLAFAWRWRRVLTTSGFLTMTWRFYPTRCRASSLCSRATGLSDSQVLRCDFFVRLRSLSSSASKSIGSTGG